ncbi:19377_t:CDS:2 [Cetraspora pellucida]|uniref:19377_t:CDS:1 n=1 Tax=Cetraspora pellucida TaxID=1433469 RepID=A0A9N9JC37_9GLOM|nr:19377_t:CDS:2 [Cetraspora pellucida]
MTYNSLDSWIKGQLVAFAFSESPKNKKTKISLAQLYQIKSSIKNKGIIKNIHGNIEYTFIQSDHAIVDEEIKQEINNFIHNYTNIHGFPSLG